MAGWWWSLIIVAINVKLCTIEQEEWECYKMHVTWQVLLHTGNNVEIIAFFNIKNKKANKFDQ